MRLAALFSGGKDSTYALYWALQQGFEVKHLVSMHSKSEESYMYHVPNIHLTDLQAKAIGIPLIKGYTSGEEEKEVEDLKKVLEDLNIDGIVAGALESEYQRTRIEKVCHELGLVSYTPLWHKNSEQLLREMIHAGFDIIIVGVSAYGLGKEWLGRKIDEKAVEELKRLNQKYGIHIGGEGGEFETFVKDAPFFKARIIFDEVERYFDEYTYSGILSVKRAHLEWKE
jgi:predicted ATP pyrophosphatase (TIGR00289 family)